MIEFYEKELRAIEERLKQKYNFEILDHRLDVTGYCVECKKDGSLKQNARGLPS